MSFGKKGLAPGESAPRPAGFGGATPATRRAADPYGSDMSAEELAAKREAFIASERVRSGNSEGPANAGTATAAIAARPMDSFHNSNHDPAPKWEPAPQAVVNQSRSRSSDRKFVFGDPQGRNLLVAYVLWYFASLLSIHRFYCGHGDSAWYQIGLLVGGIVTLVIWPPLGIAALVGWFGWIFLDLFLMPGMMRRFKAAHAFSSTDIFA